MIGFFLKKSFFDGWDNLFSLILLNVGFIAVIALFILLPLQLGLPFLPALCLGSLPAAIWLSACVFALKSVSDFGSFHIKDIVASLRMGLAPGLHVGVLLVLAFVVLSVGLPFYLKLGGILGAMAAGVIFWCSVIVVLALQYYLPLRARLGGGLYKNLRKSFILFFDNPGFSLFLFLYSSVNFAVSFVLAFLIPGIAGLALAGNVALRLRLYKYDWAEEHPEANRREVPWDELLAEDKDLVGKRTLKGMIFPWRE